MLSNVGVKSLDIADMRINRFDGLELPDEMHELVTTVKVSKGKHMLFDSAGHTYFICTAAHERWRVERRASLPAARLAFCAALSPCGTFVYALGGLSPGGDFVNTIVRYSFESDSWQTITGVQFQPFVDAVAVTMPDGIYLLGGTEPGQMPG